MHTGGERGPRGRGVSNVIGVILVVGITVVLASFAAVYLLGLGSSVEQPPDNVRLETSYDDAHAGDGEVLTIRHEAGNDLQAAQVSIDVDGAAVTGGGDATPTTDFAAEVGSDDVFRSGETIELDRTDFARSGGGAIAPQYLDLGDAEVRLVWQSNAEATSSHTIYVCDVAVPDCENRE